MVSVPIDIYFFFGIQPAEDTMAYKLVRVGKIISNTLLLTLYLFPQMLEIL